MTRDFLRPLRNKTVTVTADLVNVYYKSKFDANSTYKLNVGVLLKNVIINGEYTDHIWLYERNKYYDIYKELIGERVKFKGVVSPYVKNKDGIYQEDYGIERKSSIMPEEVFDREKPSKK
ncbi:hypothetical protein [Mammaliicoccus lentus]|uniref:hypothetical protein n=1 Tax=Mammaliicoccus lentus TaxID=42858 RepID=UPI0010726936|nr:hypothetical protein [Mammaliicoccus lentus]MBF0795244.1 hypothetical protein [Mammaliicoccus lentus]TFV14640.1 hypothetical protein E4T78_11285 [Mammaliicoccus lentus]